DVSSISFVEENSNNVTLTLAAENDAAATYFGGKWRTPTNVDFNQLVSQCYLKWVYNYHGSGVGGLVVYKAKIDSDKGKSSLPTAPDTPEASYTLADAHIFIPVTNCYFQNHLFSDSEGWWDNCALLSSSYNVSRKGSYVFWYYPYKYDRQYRGVVPLGALFQAACVRPVCD
nr:hypothetical protein [Bacteroidaceae bacterium]